MLTLAFTLVICSGMLNALWNLFTKKSLNKTVFLWSIHLVAAAMYMPYFIYELITVDIALHGYLAMLLSLCFHALYMFTMAKAYTIGDLSQVYPIMRGMGALLVPIISVLFLYETMSGIGWLGLVVLLAGIFVLGEWNFAGVSKRPVLYACLIGCFIAGYTLSDKMALQFTSPLALVQVSNLACLVSLTRNTLRSGEIKREWGINRSTIIIGAFIAPGGYILYLFAMEMGQLAQLAPIREIGIVFATLFGIILLKESQGRRRLISAVLITIGVIVIKGWGGT